MQSPPALRSVLTLVCTGLLFGCTPKVALQSPDEPIRIDMTVTVRVQVEQQLDESFRDDDSLTGRLAMSDDDVRTRSILGLSHGGRALERAKLDGYLGELRSGYLGEVRPEPPDWVKVLRTRVNARREETYREIAQTHAVRSDAVAAAGGQMLVERAMPTQYVESGDGAWVQR